MPSLQPSFSTLPVKRGCPNFCVNGVKEDDDPKTYLTALRKVVEARGGMATVAQKTDLSRETLYRTLSSRGNPTIRTLSAVLKATGLKFGVSAH